MAHDRKPAPDGDTRQTGSSDPYLGSLASSGRGTGLEGACPQGGESVWAGDERRSDTITCFDPYIVELTRPIRHWRSATPPSSTRFYRLTVPAAK